VDIISFLSEVEEGKEDANIDIVKKNERKVIGSRGSPFGYMYESLAYRMTGKNMEPYIITINDQIPNTEFQHEGEELIYVLEGKIEFYYEGKTYVLEEGDNAYFNSGIPHSGRSIGTKTAKFLCMMYSYKRV
jgi:quercetin dioxygenase-like cupin family protein